MSDKKQERGAGRKGADRKWGTWLAAALIVAALCVAVLFYIGWFDNNTHVDAPDGDNVESQYQIDVDQPEAPGVNDWQNPDNSDLDRVVVQHAEGTDTVPRGE